MIRLLIIFVIISQVCLAQEKKQGKIGEMVNYVISKNMNTDALMDSPKGMVYFFSVTLLLNSEGKVDTGFYSKKLDKKISDVMGLNASLIRKIKEQNMVYKNYASKVVVIPIFFYRYTDAGIEYSTGFINSIQNLLPNDEPKLWGKSWIVLDPIINPFMKTH